MAEYIEREAALALVRPDDPNDKRCAVTVETAKRLIRHALTAAPAADVAPVVRCKDCKYSTLPSMQTQIYGKPGTLTCHNRKSPCNNRNVASEDYCKRGEREEE